MQVEREQLETPKMGEIAEMPATGHPERPEPTTEEAPQIQQVINPKSNLEAPLKGVEGQIQGIQGRTVNPMKQVVVKIGNLNRVCHLARGSMHLNPPFKFV